MLPMSFRAQRFALALTALLFLGADSPTRPLDIYFIDVMGGAATLIVTPERESVLIDTGWPGFEDRDPKRIEHVLKGGAEGLARRVRIDHFWDRGLPDLGAPDADKVAFPDGPKADSAIGIAYRRA